MSLEHFFKTISVGSWLNWYSWGSCSSACGTGTQTRSRTFTGASPCSGSSTESQSCTCKLSFLKEYKKCNYTLFTDSWNMVNMGRVVNFILNQLLKHEISESDKRLLRRGTPLQWQRLQLQSVEIQSLQLL